MEHKTKLLHEENSHVIKNKNLYDQLRIEESIDLSTKIPWLCYIQTFLVTYGWNELQRISDLKNQKGLEAKIQIFLSKKFYHLRNLELFNLPQTQEKFKVSISFILEARGNSDFAKTFWQPCNFSSSRTSLPLVRCFTQKKWV